MDKDRKIFHIFSVATALLSVGTHNRTRVRFGFAPIRLFITFVENRLPYGKNDPKTSDRRTRRMVTARRGADEPAPRALRAENGRHRTLGGIARRLRQRLPLFRLAVGRRAGRLVAARVAAGGARRLRLRRLQQLAAHRNPHAQGCRGGLERLFPRGDVPRPAAARLALQDPRPRRQRLAGPHPGLRPARRAGRRDQKLHGAVLEPCGTVRLAGRRVRRLEDRQPADLRSPCGHGPGARGRGNLPRIHRKDTPDHQKGRLQRRAADGRGRAPLLRVVRLPRVEFLRPLVALRHARGAEGADPPRP